MTRFKRLTSNVYKHRVVLSLTAVCSAVLVLGALAILPSAYPDTGARTADALRAVVGVAPVSDLESLSNRLRDDLNRLRYGHGDALPQISWLDTVQTAAPTPAGETTVPSPGRLKDALLAPAPNVVNASPQIGWQAFGPLANGAPAMARTMLLVDPHRSYAGVALVRIDLTQLALHAMPGTIEPAHPSGINRAVPSLGMVPSSDLPRLAAAFNGGFKAEHGHYGMMANGFALLPPIDGMATVAIYKSGRVGMGAWNHDIYPSADMIAFRQNCPPLIDAGQINPALDTAASRAWGFTHNTDITWRTGLGLTHDGHYLIYAVGNGTNAKFLAQALQEAGAYWGMQLDINEYYAQFDIYAQLNGQPVAERLLDQMTATPSLFLTPDPRDFFYLTTR